jgi:hypothetical protein
MFDHEGVETTKVNPKLHKLKIAIRTLAQYLE